MSKLDDLLQKLCPNGVEFLKLGDCCKIKTGKLNANAMKEDGQYAFFTCDKKQYKINTYSFDTEAILISGNGSQVGHINYYKGKFDAYQRTYVLSDFINLETLFLFYYLKSKLKEYILKFAKNGSVPYITLPMLQTFEIPVPPLEVQSEIVRIMDNFTELTTELTAELSARRKQYEYYRDSLLTFGDDVPVYSLSEIATDIYRGSGIKRDEVTETGIECVRYGEIYTKYNIHFETCFSHTQLETVKSPKYFEHGDILFAITGESVEDISKSTVYTGNNKCLAGGDIVVVKHNQNPKYLGYVLSTANLRQQKQKGKVKSKVVHASVADIGSLRVPIPSLEEQERIVSILDRFDTLCNDLTSGLPAEIEARQKQYEYYRDKLLDFKKAE